jgi:Leucine zipper
MSFSSLSPEHEEQVLRRSLSSFHLGHELTSQNLYAVISFLQVHQYLRFMRAKREIALKQLDNEFSDTKNDRLLEQMYSQEDVEALLDDLGRLVRSNVRQEIGAFMGMTSIILKQLLEGAEERGVTTLEINTGKVEDRGESSHISFTDATVSFLVEPACSRQLDSGYYVLQVPDAYGLSLSLQRCWLRLIRCEQMGLHSSGLQLTD